MAKHLSVMDSIISTGHCLFPTILPSRDHSS